MRNRINKTVVALAVSLTLGVGALLCTGAGVGGLAAGARLASAQLWR